MVEAGSAPPPLLVLLVPSSEEAREEEAALLSRRAMRSFNLATSALRDSSDASNEACVALAKDVRSMARSERKPMGAVNPPWEEISPSLVEVVVVLVVEEGLERRLPPEERLIEPLLTGRVPVELRRGVEEEVRLNDPRRIPEGFVEAPEVEVAAAAAAAKVVLHMEEAVDL